MELKFSNGYFKGKALSVSRVERENEKTVEEAFFLLLKGIKSHDLSNLCKKIKAYFAIPEKSVHLSLEECYRLTQGEQVRVIVVDNMLKEKILELAYECIESGKCLGDNIIPNTTINTSEWLSHSLYEGKLARELAIKMGLDPVIAQKQGMLHDYGRKFDHTFGHVIKGYEALTEEGFESEAIACLTHSFLGGNRCANNEEAEEGFFVDEEGNPGWNENVPKDDIGEFLEKYKYDDYDIILNVADLMATGKGIVSPFARIEDIATRRGKDKLNKSANRGYFLAEFSNKLLDMLIQMRVEIQDVDKLRIKAKPGISVHEIENRFKKISDIFFTYYTGEVASERSYISVADISEATSGLGYRVVNNAGEWLLEPGKDGRGE